MATIHYEKNVLNSLTTNCIEFKEKLVNTPNCPHARPNKLYWAVCKKEYGLTPRAPKSIRGFRIMWKNISERVS